MGGSYPEDGVGSSVRVQVLGYHQRTDEEHFTTVTIPAAVITS